jgi:hypothetical protein
MAGRMKRIAVFGNAGAGKSRLARELAAITGLKLHVIDMMQFREGGAAVPHEEFLAAHAALLREDEWIIDGFGSVETAWQRFERADTLIHVDPPLPVLAWGVTKRLVAGQFDDPAGWPTGSPVWQSSLNSYGVLLPCHRELTPRYRQLIADKAATKRVFALQSRAQMQTFLETMRRENKSA